MTDDKTVRPPRQEEAGPEDERLRSGYVKATVQQTDRDSPGLDGLLIAAAKLVDAIGDQAARDRASYDAGYRYAARTFFDLGFQAGYQRAEELATLRWAPVAECVGRLAGLPAYADLERIRWDGRREDFGRPRPSDFPGFRRQRGAA